MSGTATPIFPQVPKLGLVQFLQGTDVAGTYKTLYTAAGNNSKIIAITECNNDPSATHLITLQIVRSAVKYGGVAFTTAVSEGFANAATPKNVLLQTLWPGLPLDSDGNPFLFLESGDTLAATFATALTAAAVINLQAIGADF